MRSWNSTSGRVVSVLFFMALLVSRERERADKLATYHFLLQYIYAVRPAHQNMQMVLDCRGKVTES